MCNCRFVLQKKSVVWISSRMTGFGIQGGVKVEDERHFGFGAARQCDESCQNHWGMYWSPNIQTPHTQGNTQFPQTGEPRSRLCEGFLCTTAHTYRSPPAEHLSLSSIPHLLCVFLPFFRRVRKRCQSYAHGVRQRLNVFKVSWHHLQFLSPVFILKTVKYNKSIDICM